MEHNIEKEAMLIRVDVIDSDPILEEEKVLVKESYMLHSHPNFDNITDLLNHIPYMAKKMERAKEGYGLITSKVEVIRTHSGSFGCRLN